jgi:hypothetical protein
MRNPRKHHSIAGVGTFLVTVALVAGMVSCGEVAPPVQYDLTISTTQGGQVTTPGEGTFTYSESEKVNLAAIPDEGYRFVNWTGDVGEIADIEDATTVITMKDDYSITATFAVKQYSLVIHRTEGGSVTTPGENAYTYEKGAVVSLVAVADEGYVFINWTGDVSTIADVNAASTTITMNGGYSISANFAGAIRDWYDLDAIRDNLNGNYLLVNDLDSTTAGYEELASPTANGGKGWQPIGSLFADPFSFNIVDLVDPFPGRLDGQGYEIRDLFISRPDEDAVGLFGCVGKGVIQNLGLVIAEVTGHVYVGGLVGGNWGSVGNSHCRGNVTGEGAWFVGGLVGGNWGTVSDSYSTGSVTGDDFVGGLAGSNWRAVSNSYSTGSVTGFGTVGGLVGWNHQGTVSNSYSTGSVTGSSSVGGLVGQNQEGSVSNSYYSYDEVLINGRNIITIGALSNEDFEQWLANDKFLDVNERLSQEDGYYLINDVSDFKQLLAFGQNGSLKFRLKHDLDLGHEPDFYIPYLAGEFDGNGHGIANLRFSFEFISQVGLFGYLASGGKVTGVGAEDVNITGPVIVGGLVGENDGGTVSNSYSSGSVTGPATAGGLVGWIGLNGGTVSNSYYNYDEVLINDRHVITIGALFGEDFDQWLANAKVLDVNERLTQEDGYYVINDVTDFKQLLAFGQDASLKFRLKNDLNLGDDPNLYIPYLVGEFDGNGHIISNLGFNFDFVSNVGLFGYLASGGKVTRVGIGNANITGQWGVAGLTGASMGAVSNSYSTGRVTGINDVGGLVGWNKGTVSTSYSSSSVAGSWGVGGLLGLNQRGTVNSSYSTGKVTGDGPVGGLVGENYVPVSVGNSFWDTETSGQTTSDGGTGKTTAEMKSITTFSAGGWNIVAVATGQRNPAYIWNIVEGQTYPFLSWQF